MNLRRKRFCQEYIIDFNATQAAIRAGYSEHTAKVQGSKILTSIDVELYIDQLMDGVTERAKLTVDSVLVDIGDIKRYHAKTNPSVSLKACELEAKYLGILTERLDLNAKVEGSFHIEFTRLNADKNTGEA